MNSLLYFFSHAPHGQINAQEGLDALLMGSAFTSCSVVFIEAGVLQLMRDQQPEQAGFKDFAKGFAALPDYGVHQIACCETSLNQYGLSAEDLVIDVDIISPEKIKTMIAEHDKVLNF